MNREKLTLHKAMQAVLRNSPDRTATYKLLADQIARQGLYLRGDGQPAPSGQVRARARRYPALFEMLDGEVRLK